MNKLLNLISNLYIQILCESIICQLKQWNVIAAVIRIYNQKFLSWTTIFAKAVNVEIRCIDYYLRWQSLLNLQKASVLRDLIHLPHTHSLL